MHWWLRVILGQTDLCAGTKILSVNGQSFASMDDFMEFSGKALPQDGINEKEESDNNELVDY